eukprot:scaffold212751_cov33-Tisochrysis_lutea.AAC.1
MATERGVRAAGEGWGLLGQRLKANHSRAPDIPSLRPDARPLMQQPKVLAGSIRVRGIVGDCVYGVECFSRCGCGAPCQVPGGMSLPGSGCTVCTFPSACP